MSDLGHKIHDVRKPLNAISMQAELIKMLIEDSENGDKVEQAASKIIEHAKLCSELLQGLFDENQL